MPYVTGTAVSFAALLTALRAACTANGYTLSGNVLHKGTLFVETLVGTLGIGGAPANGVLTVRAGNGIDGANNLTDTVPVPSMLGRLKAGDTVIWPDWDWPVTYHAHILTDPDEVFFIVNYGAGEFIQFAMFGQSPAPGNPGTGNWHSATFCGPGLAGPQIISDTYLSLTPAGGFPGLQTFAGSTIPAPFWWAQKRPTSNESEVRLASKIHGAIHEADGTARWSNEFNPFETTLFSEPIENYRVSAAVTSRPLLGYSPNVWNNEAHLLPIQISQARASSKNSLIGELQHIRMCRNDFINPGAVISIGPDSWKVYPCYRKNTTQRDGGARTSHSGTIAMAIRYDGP